MKFPTFSSKSPQEVIASTNTVCRDVWRYAGIVASVTFFVYFQMYYWAAGMALVQAAFGITFRYLFPRFAWYRRWIYLVTVVNVAFVVLALYTTWYWWIAVPTLFNLYSQEWFERDLLALRTEYGIREELDDFPPPPRGES